MENSRTISVASVAPGIAWILLKPEEQQQLLEYLDKVKPKEENTERKQEEVTTAG